MNKLIKKYQTPWGTNGIQYASFNSGLKQPGLNMFKTNANDFSADFTKNLYKNNQAAQPKINFTSISPSLQNGASSIFGKIQGINTMTEIKLSDAATAPLKSLDPITGLATDKALKSAATSQVAKASGAAKLAGTMDVVSAIGAPVLGMGEEIANSFGANIKTKDELSGGIDAVAPLANMLVPGLGVGLQAVDLLDRSLGKKTKGVNINAGSGFTGTNVNEESKNFRLSQTGKANRWKDSLAERTNNAGRAKHLVDDAMYKQAGNIANAGNIAQNNTNKLNNNFNKGIFLSKQGSRLEKLQALKSKKNVIKNKQDLPLNDVQASVTASNAKDFSSGGFKISKDNKVTLAQHGSVVDGQETLGKNGMAVNVIPDGALHAHKHHMEDTNNEMTKKGIPVITIAEKGDVLDHTTQEKAKGGEITQHAEIEKEEIILHLDLTKKLEKLMEENTEESKIEAGKLLAMELMENTQDNTGLTDKLLNNEN